MTTRVGNQDERGAAAVSRFPCTQCGAEVAFAPGTTHLRCPYCGAANEIALDVSPIDEQDYVAHLHRLAEVEGTRDAAAVKCGACGAETDRPPNLDAFRCAFCGSSVVSEELTTRLIRPRAVLPFHITAEQARTALRRWISSRWFAPTDFKRHATTGDRLQGVYLPYWTYDSRTVTDYTGQRGEHYWDTESYTATVNGKHVRKTRRVRKTRWYPVAGQVGNTFDDLLVEATRSLPVKWVRELEPWDLANLVPYAADYLAGFRAERYQVELEAGFSHAAQLMEPPIRAAIRRDIGGDDQRIHDLDVRYFDVTFKHLLLPTWISATRYRGKVYRVLVNARTGEVLGDRPWSTWKIVLLILGIVAGLAAMVGLVALVGALGGR